MGQSKRGVSGTRSELCCLAGWERPRQRQETSRWEWGRDPQCTYVIGWQGWQVRETAMTALMVVGGWWFGVLRRHVVRPAQGARTRRRVVLICTRCYVGHGLRVWALVRMPFQALIGRLWAKHSLFIAGFKIKTCGMALGGAKKTCKMLENINGQSLPKTFQRLN